MTITSRLSYAFTASLLLFTLSPRAEARVCTPAGELCDDGLSCCEGSCLQGICQSALNLAGRSTLGAKAPMKGESCEVRASELKLDSSVCAREIAKS